MRFLRFSSNFGLILICSYEFFISTHVILIQLSFYFARKIVSEELIAKLVRRNHVLKLITQLFGFYLIFIKNSRIIEICLHFSNKT